MRDSADSDYDPPYGRVRRATNRGKQQFTDEADTYAKRGRHRGRLRPLAEDDSTDGLPDGDRWSTWDQSTPLERGPVPHPGWLVTELAAVDTELGILKTGKEADVYLVRRGVPGTEPTVPAGRQALSRRRPPALSPGLRLPGGPSGPRVPGKPGGGEPLGVRQGGHRGPVGERRVHRAVPAALRRTAGPLPGADHRHRGAAGVHRRAGRHRCAAARRNPPGPAELADLWDQLTSALGTLAAHGFAHGDLSPYNLLVHRERLVMIDLPQVIDVIANPNGPAFLVRDARNVATWFAKAGHPHADPDAPRGPAASGGPPDVGTAPRPDRTVAAIAARQQHPLAVALHRDPAPVGGSASLTGTRYRRTGTPFCDSDAAYGWPCGPRRGQRSARGAPQTAAPGISAGCRALIEAWTASWLAWTAA